MEDLFYDDVDYCKYGMSYRKELGYGITYMDGPLDPYVKEIVET